MESFNGNTLRLREDAVVVSSARTRTSDDLHIYHNLMRSHLDCPA